MAKNVYLWPECIGSAFTYSPQNRVTAETEFFGGWSQETEVTPRVRLTGQAEILPGNHAAWEIFLDRIAGGTAFFAITNQNLRQRQGWDVFPAVNTSGAEFWGPASNLGATSTYAGESAGATWRSIFCQLVGAHIATDGSLAVDGLLANEVVKAGTPLRPAGQSYRYTVREDATANGSGAATLKIGKTLRADLADNTNIRLPGDFAAFRLLSYAPGACDADGVETVTIEAHEVYESEITGGYAWRVD